MTDATVITVRIVGTRLPGRTCAGHVGVQVGLQVGREVADVRDGDASEVVWEAQVRVRPGADGGWTFTGKAIHGRGGERFLYLVWLEQQAAGEPTMFRRAKLQLDAVPSPVLEDVIRDGRPLVATLELTDGRRMPVCASVRPPAVSWSVG